MDANMFPTKQIRNKTKESIQRTLIADHEEKTIIHVNRRGKRELLVL